MADEVAALAQTKVTDLTQEELQKELATFSVENRRKLQAALTALDCQQLVDSGAGDLVARIATPDAVEERWRQPFMKDTELMLSLWEAIIRECDYEMENECHHVDWDDGQKDMRRTAWTTRMFITWVLKAIRDVGPRLRRDVHMCGCKIIDRICYNEDTVGMWVHYGAPQVVGEVMKLHQNDTDIDWRPIFWAFWHLAGSLQGSEAFNAMGLQDLLQAGRPMRSRITEALEAEAKDNPDMKWMDWVRVFEPMLILVRPRPPWSWSPPLARPVNFVRVH